MNGVRQDLAYGLRSLWRQRGYAALAVVVLASAIGLNTSLFTAFNAVLLRPWSVPEPSRVVKVFATGKNGRIGGLALAEQRFLSEHAKSFRGLVAMRDGGSHRGLSYKHVTGNFFDVLRVPMAVGRGFGADEDRPDAPVPVAVLSYSAWQQRFAGREDIVGRTVEISGVLFTIVGVTARGFTGTEPNRRDAWLPMSSITLLRPHDAGVRDMLTLPGHCCSAVAGRLAAGVSPEQARAEITRLSHQFQAQHGIEERDIGLSSTSLIAEAKPQVLAVSGVMFAAVTLVLLLACANVGNLVLARTLARRREIAVRLSLGAPRTRIVQQLMTENLVLAAVAGIIGIASAYWLPVRLLSAAGSNLGLDVRPDLTVLAFTAATVLLACLVFGLAPALHCTRSGAGALNERAESSTLRLRLRGALLGVQVAISVVLLAGAGLLVRGVQHAYRLDPGFSMDGVSVLSIGLDGRTYDGARTREFYERLRTQLASLPGSAPYGFTRLTPLSTSSSSTRVKTPSGEEERVLVHTVSAGYFEVLRIPILQGRNFAAADEGRPAVLVNESFARRLWPQASAVGQQVPWGGKPHEVIGLVRDVRTTSLDRVEPTLYAPFGRDARDSVHGLPQVLIRDNGQISSAALGALVARIDPNATTRVARLADNLDASLSPSRVGAALAGGLGALALLLATIGLAGVFAYVVEQRTREIGIRVALGARPADVVKIVLGSTSRATALGLVAGMLGALGAAHGLRSFLYGMSPLDPAVYGLVMLLLLTAALVASYLPARRALRVDPTVALRYE